MVSAEEERALKTNMLIKVNITSLFSQGKEGKNLLSFILIRTSRRSAFRLNDEFLDVNPNSLKFLVFCMSSISLTIVL